MKNWLKNKKWSIALLFIGATAGFLYWQYIGCESGSCGITSSWYKTSAFGGIIGWLIGDIAYEEMNSSNNKA